MAPEKPKGTFLNYDIRTNQTFGVGASAMQTTGLFEYNTFFNGLRANYQAVARTSGTESTPAFERMAAALSHENADTATTWTLGDNNSYAGNGVAPVRFTGYQYRKDFSLTPVFVLLLAVLSLLYMLLTERFGTISDFSQQQNWKVDLSG